jgi:hypothetical protein
LESAQRWNAAIPIQAILALYTDIASNCIIPFSPAAVESGTTRGLRSDSMSKMQQKTTKSASDRMAWSLWFAAFAIFLSVTQFDFVDYDDLKIVFELPQVASGLSWGNLSWAFSTLHADFAYWMPLTWLSHQFDCQFFGRNAGAHHLTNVLLHATNTLLLFRVLHKVTGCMWRSASVALLFAWHPLHVESVAWVAERKSLVCSLFWMLTFLAYLRYVAGRTWQRYVLVFTGCLCALMGKPMAVTLPFSLLLLDFWPLKRWESGGQLDKSFWDRWRGLILEKIPLLALSIIGGFLAYLAQKDVGAVRDDVPLLFRIENAIAAYWIYVRKAFCPDDLIPIYERHPWSLGIVIWAGIFLSGIGFICFRFRQKYPYLLMGFLWYVGNLVPSIGLVPISAHAMADRYTYIPLIGLFIMVSWGVADAFLISKLSPGRIGFAGSAFAAVSFAALAYCTLSQLAFWRNGVTLFTHAVSVAPWSPRAHYLLGMNLLRQDCYEESLTQGYESLRLDSTRPEPFVLIATVLRKTGKFVEAKSFLERALAIKADDKPALSSLAYLLATADAADIRDGVVAVRLAKHLCSLSESRNPKYLSILACAYAEAGQFDEATRTAEMGSATARKVGDTQWAHVLDDQERLFRDQKHFRAAP